MLLPYDQQMSKVTIRILNAAECNYTIEYPANQASLKYLHPPPANHKSWYHLHKKRRVNLRNYLIVPLLGLRAAIFFEPRPFFF